MRQNHSRHSSERLSTTTSTGVSGTATLETAFSAVTETLTAERLGSEHTQVMRPISPLSVLPRETAVVSVLLVDDHALLREGLRQLLELEEDIRVVGEAVDGFEALQKVRQLRPDVVLMDIRMPLLDGIAVTRQLAHEAPAIGVIILTMCRTQQQVLHAMKNGAKGYLLKSASSQEVVQAIRTVHNGDMLIEPGMTGAIVRELRRLSSSNSNGHALDTLSEKEVEILRYVATGMSNKEIADQLAYSEKTVKNYLSVIFQKLGIRDRTQAAIFALRNGILPDEEL